MGIINRLHVIPVRLRKASHFLVDSQMEIGVYSPSLRRLGPCFEMAHKAGLTVLDSLLKMQCIVQGFLNMACSDKVE